MAKSGLVLAKMVGEAKFLKLSFLERLETWKKEGGIFSLGENKKNESCHTGTVIMVARFIITEEGLLKYAMSIIIAYDDGWRHVGVNIILQEVCFYCLNVFFNVLWVFELFVVAIEDFVLLLEKFIIKNGKVNEVRNFLYLTVKGVIE